jgi:hypothetical protein
VLGNVEQAHEIWLDLVDEDEGFRDPDWFRKALNWAEPLAEEARRLIDGLSG